MRVCKYISLLLIVIIAFSCKRISNSTPETAPNKLHQIINKGVLRVVTDFSSTSYFIYRGQPMGYQFEMLQELANHLGVKLKVTVNNDLNERFDLLESEDVDLIAANLTVTKELRNRIEFTTPLMQTQQVLVQRKPSNWKELNFEKLDNVLIRNQLDLAKKKIYVLRGSSYVQRLLNLSDEIGDSIQVIESDKNVEQLIEMVATGEIDYTVVDNNIAQVYVSVFENIDIETPVSFPQNLSWAVAKGSEDLKTSIDSWLLDFKKTRKYATIYHKYYRNRRSLEILGSDVFVNSSGKISPYDALIKQYSEKIGWDWRLVASMIYQESRFNPQAKSFAGAFGLMQMMPVTAKRFNLEPASVKSQIKAGVEFIEWLDDKLSDIKDKNERERFVLAAYNVGLGHVIDARALALKNGKNPNIWVDNVDDFIVNKSDPKFYSDPVVKYGYCKGTETYRYVVDIMERYEHYKNLIEK